MTCRKRHLFRLVLVLLAVLFCSTPAWAASSSGTCGDNLTWRYEKSVLTIQGSGRMSEFFEGKGAHWRHWAAQTERVVIGDGVTSLSYEAFAGFKALRSAEIGDGVREIHTAVFSGLPALQSVTLGEGVEYVETMAFRGCPALQEVHLGSHVRELGRLAFADCTSLQKISLPGSLRRIGSAAFSGCTALETLKLPGKLSSIGADALKETAWMAAQPEGPLYLGKVFLGWKGPLPQDTVLSVRDGTRMIGDGAMVMDSRLSGLVLPDSVQHIGASAFDNCRRLASAELAGVTSLGSCAFSGCTALRTLDVPDSVTTLPASVFSGAGLTMIHLGSHLDTISQKAFSRCLDLQVISLPSSLRTLDSEVFYGCTALEEVTFRGAAPRIARDAFYDVTARVYYGSGWDSSDRQDYCGDLRWVPRTSSLSAPELHLSIDPSDGKPRLHWTAVSGADSYQVYHRVGKEGPFLRLTTAHGTALRNGSAVPGTACYYRVRAVQDGAVGPFSKTKNLTCDCAMPSVTLSLREDGRPVLRWEAVDGAERYEILRGMDGSEPVHFYTVSGTKFVNSSAEGGHTYTYQVRALCENSYGNGAPCAPVSVRCPSVPEAPSVQLGFDYDSGQPQLSWMPVPDAESYEIWRSTGEEEPILLATTEETSFSDSEAVIGSVYRYQVRGINAFFTGPFSEVQGLNFSLLAPELTLSIRDDGKPALRWNTVGGAERYEVLCSETGETNSFQSLFTTTGTRLNHISAVPGTTYYYCVRAISGGLAGPPSEIQSVLCPPLTAPELTLSVRDDGKPVLRWNSVSFADRYEVLCSETGEADSFQSLFTTSGTHLNHVSAVPGITYYYCVRALSGDFATGL